MKVNGKWYNTRCGLPRFCVHVCSPQHSLSGEHNLTAVLDTGTPLSTYCASCSGIMLMYDVLAASIDSLLVEDIHGSYTSLIDDGPASVVSCDTMINVSIVLGCVLVRDHASLRCIDGNS